MKTYEITAMSNNNVEMTVWVADENTHFNRPTLFRRVNRNGMVGQVPVGDWDKLTWIVDMADPVNQARAQVVKEWQRMIKELKNG